MKALEDEYTRVSDAMGDTSVNAQLLKSELDNATDAFENNKQTAKEMREAHQRYMEEYAAYTKARDESLVATHKEGQSIINLANELDRLIGLQSDDAGIKQQILGIVELLNKAMPELGLSYDEYTNSLNKGVDAIKAVVEAEAARRKNAKDFETMIAAQEKYNKLIDDEKDAKEAARVAQELLAKPDRGIQLHRRRTHYREHGEQLYRRRVYACRAERGFDLIFGGHHPRREHRHTVFQPARAGYRRRKQLIRGYDL